MCIIHASWASLDICDTVRRWRKGLERNWQRPFWSLSVKGSGHVVSFRKENFSLRNRHTHREKQLFNQFSTRLHLLHLNSLNCLQSVETPGGGFQSTHTRVYFPFQLVFCQLHWLGHPSFALDQLSSGVKKKGRNKWKEWDLETQQKDQDSKVLAICSLFWNGVIRWRRKKEKKGEATGS